MTAKTMHTLLVFSQMIKDNHKLKILRVIYVKILTIKTALNLFFRLMKEKKDVYLWRFPDSSFSLNSDSTFQTQRGSGCVPKRAGLLWTLKTFIHQTTFFQCLLCAFTHRPLARVKASQCSDSQKVLPLTDAELFRTLDTPQKRARQRLRSWGGVWSNFLRIL